MELKEGYKLEWKMMNAIGVGTEWHSGRQALKHKENLSLQSYLKTTPADTSGTVAFNAPRRKIRVLCSGVGYMINNTGTLGIAQALGVVGQTHGQPINLRRWQDTNLLLLDLVPQGL